MAPLPKIGIACFGSYGGSGVVATELGRALAKRGYEVHFLSNQLPFRLLSTEAPENIYYHEVETVYYDALPHRSYGLEVASRILRVAEEHSLNVLHAHYAVPHAISALLAKLILLPRELHVVTTLHGTDITLVGVSPSYYELTRWAIEHSDAVTCVSKWLRDRTLQEFKITRPPLVVYNFVDMARFKKTRSDRLFRSYFADEDEKIILHVSNFRPVKRIPDAIRAFALVLKKLPARLLLLGDGPERDACAQLVHELGISRYTLFLGKQHPIEKFYSIADLLMMPSEYESFGMAALEASAAGVPVICTGGSGLAEVVVDGITGFLCEVGNAEMLAARAIEVLSNPQLARQMGNAARRRAATCFNLNKIISQYERIYHALLAGQELPSDPQDCTG
jgi:N-acetyl-alpha-D-glucosaminyl L-malate synthase BshA